jgi:PadR family transcriptional regulator, regulatory protein AphA
VSKENKSRYALLGLLSLGSMSGYDLKKLAETSIGNFWHESYAQIYPILKQLEQEGLAVKYTEKQEGRPERSIYSLTDRGCETLRQWLLEPAEHQIPRNELLLKLFFATQMPLTAMIEHIQKYRAMHVQLLQQQEQIRAATIQTHRKNPGLPYWLITFNYGQHFSQAMLSWCDETLATLEQLVQQRSIDHNEQQ